MVVNNRNGSDTVTLNVTHPFIIRNVTPDGIPYAFRTRRITSFFDNLIKFTQKVSGRETPIRISSVSIISPNNLGLVYDIIL